MNILEAEISDSDELTTLMRASKAHWGYSEVQMQKWQGELTVSASYIDENQVYKLVNDGQLVAYYSFLFLSNNTVKLDSLFVLPDFIGQGVGQYLLDDFINKAQEYGASCMTLDADPNAEGFYTKNGFNVAKRVPTSIKGRTMPIMTKSI